MANEQPTISEAEGLALSDTVHGGTGVRLLTLGATEDDTPDHWTQLAQQYAQTQNLLGESAHGIVLSKENGLQVIVIGVPRYLIGGTVFALADAVFTCTDDETNYLYADSDGVVETNITAFPDDVLKLAVVICASGAITSIKQAKIENTAIGGTNLWYNVAAAAQVEMGGNNLNNLGFLKYAAGTKTLVAGAFTPTEGVHVIDGEGSVDDDLVTITAVAGERKTILITAASGVTITIKPTGNINVAALFNFGVGQWVCLFQDTDTSWRVMWRSPALLGGDLTSPIDGAGFGILDLEGLAFKPLDRTISNGSISIDVDLVKTFILVDTQSAAATDDLDLTAYRDDGDLLILTPKSTARTVVVKHAAGGVGEFILANELDFVMDTSEHMLVCMGRGLKWVEVCRSPMIGFDIVADPGTGGTARPGRALPVLASPIFIPGVIVVQSYVEFKATFPFTLRKAEGRVITAPTGGPLIVDITVNGASIFLDDSERINILDAAFSDQSVTKNKEVVVGDVVKILVITATGTPADLTIFIDAAAAPQTPP